MTNPKYAVTDETGRTYDIPGYEDIVFRSVTTLLNIIAKPALYRWYALKVAEYVVMNGVSEDGSSSDAIKRLTNVPFDFTRASQALGSGVHKAVELYAYAKLSGDSKPYIEYIEQNANLRPYVETFERFIEEEGFEIVASERTVFHVEDEYAGTLDLILSDGTKNFVVDIKTGGVYPTAALQMVAYARAPMYLDERGYAQRNTTPIKGAFILQLKPSSAKAHYMDIGDKTYAAFIAARDLARWNQDEAKKVVIKG